MIDGAKERKKGYIEDRKEGRNKVGRKGREGCSRWMTRRETKRRGMFAASRARRPTVHYLYRLRGNPRGPGKSSSQTVPRAVWNTVEIRKSGKRFHFSVACFQHQCQRRVCVSMYVCVYVRSASLLRPLIKEKKEGTLLFALCSTRFLQKEGKMSRTLEASWYSVRTCTIIFEYLCCDKEQRRHTEITIFNKDIFSSKVLVEDYSTIRYR